MPVAILEIEAETHALDDRHAKDLLPCFWKVVHLHAKSINQANILMKKWAATACNCSKSPSFGQNVACYDLKGLTCRNRNMIMFREGAQWLSWMQPL